MNAHEATATPRHFSRRFAAYLAVWILAAVAFEVLLKPEGLTETDLTEFQQRLRWPLHTPLMVLLGIWQAIGWSITSFGAVRGDFAAACVGLAGFLWLLAVAALVLKRNRLPTFASMLVVHAVTVGIGVFFFLQLAREPSGG